MYSCQQGRFESGRGLLRLPDRRGWRADAVLRQRQLIFGDRGVVREMLTDPATIVAGIPIFENDVDTGARPGQSVRA